MIVNKVRGSYEDSILHIGVSPKKLNVMGFSVTKMFFTQIHMSINMRYNGKPASL